MNIIKTISVTLLVLCAPFVTHSQTEVISKQFTDCLDKSHGSTSAQLACMDAETQRQDERLSKVYKALMTELSPERKKQLEVAQDAWIKYRDANCAFYNDPQGGPATRLDAKDCVMTDIASRAIELESFKR